MKCRLSDDLLFWKWIIFAEIKKDIGADRNEFVTVREKIEMQTTVGKQAQLKILMRMKK